MSDGSAQREWTYPEGTSAPLRYSLAVGAVVFLIIVLGFRWVHFAVVRSDLAGYLEASRHLLEHRDFVSHMPGYPALLALGRALTLGLLDEALMAQLLALLFWVVGVVLADRILCLVAKEVRGLGILVFALAPLVGVSTAASPDADLPAHALFLGAFLAALHGRWWIFTLVTGAGLLLHQAFYPFYFVLALVCVSRGMRWFQFVASGIPFVTYYVAIAIAKGNANWILPYHQRAHLEAKGTLPVFDAIIGEFMEGTMASIIKGAILLGIMVVTVALILHFVRRRNWMMLALLLPMAFYGVIANERIGFVLVRLSKLLVIPGCVWLASTMPVAEGRVRIDWRIFCAVGAVLIGSQLLWAAYIVHYYTPAGRV